MTIYNLIAVLYQTFMQMQGFSIGKQSSNRSYERVLTEIGYLLSDV